MSIKFKRGFTLVEAMFVIVILAAFLAYASYSYNKYKLNQQKTEHIDQHLHQFKMLVEASGTKANADYSTINEGESGAFNIALMSTGPYLPDNFGEQYTTDARDDLLGHWFRALYNKKIINYNGEDVAPLRLLITTSLIRSYDVFPSNVIPNKYANISTRNEYNDFVSNWYTQLASKAADVGLVAGILQASSHNIKGVNNTFSFVLDQTDFPIATQPYDRVVFFWGWPDINGVPGGVTPPGGPGNPGDSDEYVSCEVTLRSYINNSLVNDQCANESGYKNVIDFFSTPSTPSPFYAVPGLGSMFSYVRKEAITDLSSVANLCYTTSNNYCWARSGGSNPQQCGGSDPETRSRLTNACLSTPVFSVSNNLSLGGGVYRSNEMYREGYYYFGRVNGVTYEVNIGNTNDVDLQYTFCCPLDVPDL